MNRWGMFKLDGCHNWVYWSVKNHDVIMQHKLNAWYYGLQREFSYWINVILFLSRNCCVSSQLIAAGKQLCQNFILYFIGGKLTWATLCVCVCNSISFPPSLSLHQPLGWSPTVCLPVSISHHFYGYIIFNTSIVHNWTESNLSRYKNFNHIYN